MHQLIRLKKIQERRNFWNHGSRDASQDKDDSNPQNSRNMAPEGTLHQAVGPKIPGLTMPGITHQYELNNPLLKAAGQFLWDCRS